MKIIKLDTINSTNSYLRELAISEALENFTVVHANHQTEGKGQIDKKWITEPNKNLTFSILLKEIYPISEKRFINMAVSLALYDWFKTKNVTDLAIKWPNDIMSGDKKLSGILIETMLRGTVIYHTVIGIGININQRKFPKDLGAASSLSLETNKSYDIDFCLLEFLPLLKSKLEDFFNGENEKIETDYISSLYRKDEKSKFSDVNQDEFTGTIKGIAQSGNLLIEKDSGILKEYGVKEIRFL